MEEKEVQKTTEVTTEAPQQVVTTTKKVMKPAVRTGHPQAVYDTKKSIFRTYQVVWYILGVVEVLLAFRFALKVFGADPMSGFTNFIYTASNPLAVPFLGVLRTSVTPTGGTIMEWSTIIAMAVYWLVAYGIVQLIQFIKPVTPNEVEETVDSQ